VFWKIAVLLEEVSDKRENTITGPCGGISEMSVCLWDTRILR